MKDLKRTNMERSPGADPSVTMLLRAAYAPPADEHYWEGLQERILARLGEAEQPVAWWSVLSEWRTAGMIAATIALLVTGAALVREQAFEAEANRIAASAAYFNVDNLPEGEEVMVTVGSRRGSAADLPARYLNPFEP